MERLENARKFFVRDHYAVMTTGIEILEVGDHYSRAELKISDKILNGAGKVMGGAIFTLADFSFAVASNKVDENCEVTEKTVTANSSISFLNPAKGTKLISECRLIKDGHKICTYEIKISDDLGTLVALVIANGMKV